jgi:putative phosphoribosyl transferase
VIIVDDGIATGATVLAAIRGLRRRGPEKIILAVPVAPASTVSRLRLEVDDLVCLHAPEMFHAISLYYRDFGQVSDSEVIDVLSRPREFTSD